MADDFFADRVFRDYYEDVGKHPVLTAAEEKTLLLRYHTCAHCSRCLPHRVPVTNCPRCATETPAQTRNRAYVCNECSLKYDVVIAPKYCPSCGADRDLEARNKLIVSNLRFVMTTARKITKNPTHVQRLVSAGNLGLIIAVDKFDVSRETRFLTYAAWWIRKEMMDEIHNSHLIHIPSHRQKAQSKSQKYGVYVCKHCDLRVEDAELLDTALGYPCTKDAHEFVLTDDSASIHSFMTIDNLPIANNHNIEMDTIGKDTTSLLHKVITKMVVRERDRFILMQYYNIPQGERRSQSKSLHQLATITGITPERVRQIKEDVLKFLRIEMDRKSLLQMSDVCA